MTSTRLLKIAALVALCLIAVGALDIALAQGSPFGVGRAPAAPPAEGIVGWILAKQGEFYRGLSGLIRAAKADGSAVWTLLGLSFVYGIFHAAGPGHGKAVISSYLVANEETWRRGVVLSFASAVLQALVAVTIVGIAAVILNSTAKVMNEAVRWIEIASYLLIVAVGLRLLWTKGRGFLIALQRLVVPRPMLAVAGDVVIAVHDDDHHHDHHAHGHHHDAHDDRHHAHHHDHEHVHDASCGHSHGPEPKDLSGPGGWQRGLAAIVAVGLRPCSGAILVLVFAFAQGLFWAGVASTFVMGLGTAITVAVIATLAVSARVVATKFAGTRSGYGELAMRGIEVGAAVIVVAFGVLLLLGYMQTERMFGV